MSNIKVVKQNIEKAPKKYVRLVLTEREKGQGRFVEKKNGIMEYELGVGKFNAVTPKSFRLLVRSVIQATKAHKIEYLAIQFSKTPFKKLDIYDASWVVSTIIENIELANYEFNTYKTKKQSKVFPKEILLCGGLSKKEKEGFDRGKIVSLYINKARDIANTPGDDMSPSVFAKSASALAKETNVQIKVLDPKAIQKEKLHALWAVGKGAHDLPRFVIAEYWGLKKPSTTKKGVYQYKNKEEQPIVLVGKGITYDTGGLNVKPSGAMHDMHMDMSGGSSVLAAICCAAKLKVKKNIIALVPVAENAVSSRAMRAGDIISSHSGKSIEVLHTDAEGRLILADGLSYATKYDPKVLLDAATLTGAALVALGQHASVILTEDQRLSEQLQKMGEESGDYVWPLPLWDEYKTPLTKSRADVVNIEPNFSRNAGTIEGAAFLSFFVPKKLPWAHIDIAPRMESIPNDKLAKGSTGEPIRLLVKFLEQY